MSEPYYSDDLVTLYHGDCRDVLAGMPDASVDAVVTDPPYELGFMGKGWDSTGIAYDVEMWREVRRVLKPGGHVLAFGASRTWHRLAAAIEDAGFEIRDSIAWLYGSGFSKGGMLGNRPGIVWCSCGGNAVPYNHADNSDLRSLRDAIHPTPVARGEGQDADVLAAVQREAPGRGVGEARAQGSSVVGAGVGSGVPGPDDRGHEPVMAGGLVHRAGEGLPDGSDAIAPTSTGERVRRGTPARDGADDRAAGGASGGGAPREPRPSGQPAGEPDPVPGPHGALDDGALRGRAGCPRCGGTPNEFRGFSTTLKPAFEPIVVGRKPLAGTVAGNVLAHGVGALNVDGCRVGDGSESQGARAASESSAGRRYAEAGAVNLAATPGPRGGSPGGRWPTNVVLDGSQADELDAQTPDLKRQGNRSFGVAPLAQGASGLTSSSSTPATGYGDEGGASRFFPTFRYEAKAPAEERPVVDGVAHPTVKPLDLMRWLVRLVTPPGGVVLEPFAGSGTTAEACVHEHMRCVAIELEAAHLPLIVQRLTKPMEIGFDLEGLTV